MGEVSDKLLAERGSKWCQQHKANWSLIVISDLWHSC